MGERWSGEWWSDEDGVVACVSRNVNSSPNSLPLQHSPPTTAPLTTHHFSAFSVLSCRSKVDLLGESALRSEKYSGARRYVTMKQLAPNSFAGRLLGNQLVTDEQLQRGIAAAGEQDAELAQYLVREG